MPLGRVFDVQDGVTAFAQVEHERFDENVLSGRIECLYQRCHQTARMLFHDVGQASGFQLDERS